MGCAAQRWRGWLVRILPPVKNAHNVLAVAINILAIYEVEILISYLNNKVRCFRAIYQGRGDQRWVRIAS